VKLTEREVARRAKQALRDLLREIPFLAAVRTESRGRGSGTTPGLVARVSGLQKTRLLILESRTSGEPRLARQAVNQLLQYLQQYDNAYGVFVAPYISRKAAQVCEAANIGFLDLSGNCRLRFDRVFIERQGRPNKFAQKRDLRTLCSPKASRILRVLLTERPRFWRVAELARRAEVSLGLVSNLKRLLLDREWVQESNEGFALVEPRELLAEWSSNYTFRRNKARDYYSLKTASDLESSLALVCSSRRVRYALTAFSAAARIAPAVRYQRAFAYVEGPVEDIARELTLKVVTSGANVTLLEPYDAGVFYGAKQFDGIWTASPIQTYLDMASFKGRGEEAAEALLKEIIEPQW
jgi:hypothetical protein